VDLLDELELAEKTLIVFSSDNGGQLSDFRNAGQGLNLASEAGDVRIKARTAKRDARAKGHLTNLDLRSGKGSPYEGGFRVPFVVRWPGRVTPDTTSHSVVNTADMLATFADMLDVTLPRDAGEDSFSILPILQEASSKSKRPASVLQSGSGVLSMRVGDWKLVQHSRGKPDAEGRDELYNLEQDPREENNLAAKHPERVKTMNDQLKQILDSGKKPTVKCMANLRSRWHDS
jgi:arylsulfatase A